MSPPRLQLSDGGDYVVVEWRRREPEEGRGDGSGVDVPRSTSPTEPEERDDDCDRGEAPMPSPPKEPEGASDDSSAEGGGGETDADGGEGGDDGVSAGPTPWVPKDTNELLHAIATRDYGVSDDRSAKLATPAIKAYNAVAGTYEKAVQRRGQPLLEGFVIIKVSPARSIDASLLSCALSIFRSCRVPGSTCG